MEVIQYAPTTGTARLEPVAVVPAWIMMYHILDLSPGNSLICWLAGQGFTVFAISWRNPGPEDRDLGFDDYCRDGVTTALDAAGAITGAAKVHGVGYCLGGTLVVIAAAAMARDGDDRLATLSIFAVQTDFTEPGEIRVFINEAEVAFLEDMMAERGVLGAERMVGAFQMLRSNDLVWSKVVHDYLMGRRAPITDLMAWNADPTRMPARMHSDYLKGLFLNNDLAESRFRAGGRPVALADFQAPIFAVGIETNHVAPWCSAYRLDALTEGEVTFALAGVGHNAGIVSEPGHRRGHLRAAAHRPGNLHPDPDLWLEETPAQEGSWWPTQAEWLAARSGEPVAPPPMGAEARGYPVRGDAPGTYVTQP